MIVAIVGPTGTGKTALALEVAQRVGAEIVNPDSRQVYRGLDIGSAKPTVDEQRLVPHHLFDVVEPDDGITAIGSGGMYALAAAKALAAHSSLSARDIVEEALKIANNICIYTNANLTIEEL